MNSKLMTALQSGIEAHPRPFELLGARLGLSEEEVLREIAEAKERGVIRRFGAVFDSAALGFRSTLCAVDIPEKEIASKTECLLADDGVTHLYVRDFQPNVWFTLTARGEVFANRLSALAERLAPCQLFELPAGRRFKIRAVFGDAERRENPAPAAPPKLQAPLQPGEIEIVKRLQGDIPCEARLFASAAKGLATGEERLIETVGAWLKSGVVHRLGAICRHRSLGFNGNAMCLWSVPKERLQEAGELLGSCQNVSHCCERRPGPELPFNLYAMLHERDPESVKKLFDSLSAKLGLAGGRMLATKAELKKSSPVYY